MFRKIIAAVAPLALTACQSMQPPEVLPYRTPVDEASGIRDTHRHNVIGDYNSREPVDPLPWRTLNDRQAPGAGGSS